MKDKWIDAYNGVGYAFLIMAPLLAWTIMRKIGLNSPYDLISIFVIGLVCLSVGKFKPSKSRLLENISLLLLNIYFAILLFFIDDRKNFEWVVFGVLLHLILWLKERSFNWMTFAKIAHYIAVTGVVAYLFTTSTITQEIVDAGNYARVSIENEAYTLVAYACGYLIVSSLFLFFNYFRSKFYLITAIIGFYGVILAGTRSIYIGLAISMVYIFLCKTKAKNSQSKNGFFNLVFAILVICGVYIFKFDDISDRIIHISESILNGVNTIAGSDTGIDQSTLGRLYQRTVAIDLFLNNPMSGAGIKYFWVDMPILQIFSDLGLIIGIIYLYLYIFTPIKYVAHAFFSNDKLSQLFSVLYILNFPRFFLHGQPYDWTLYIYLLPLLHLKQLNVGKNN